MAKYEVIKEGRIDTRPKLVDELLTPKLICLQTLLVCCEVFWCFVWNRIVVIS